MKIVRRQRPSGIRNLAIFELLGALGCLGLLLFTPTGSGDFIALLIAGLLGLVVVYGLWTLCSWAFWLTAMYESAEIVYELFMTTRPEYHNFHIVGPLFGILMSAITLAYIFLDRTVKPVFTRNINIAK